jgi:hypothetical protein
MVLTPRIKVKASSVKHVGKAQERACKCSLIAASIKTSALVEPMIESEP